MSSPRPCAAAVVPPPIVAAVVVALLSVAPACGRKASRPGPEREISWRGLHLGDPLKRFEAAVKPDGWKLTCRPSDSVTLLEGTLLHTRWVKQAARGRLQVCRAEPATKPAGGSPGEVGARAYLLDDRIVRLNVLTRSPDADYQKALEKRYGKVATESIAVRLYQVERSGKMRTWTVRRPGAALLWMRGAQVQEIQVLPTDDRTLTALRGIAADRKGE